MKFIAEFEGEQYPLDVQREGEWVIAEVAGRRYKFNAQRIGAGVYLLLGEDGRVSECRLDHSQGDMVEVSVGERTYSIQLSEANRLRHNPASAAAHGGQSKITAAMPGKVVRVMVETGAEVEAGDPLIVVEAMKMQNEMKASRAGRIASINTEAGATVSAGDVLIIIE